MPGQRYLPVVSRPAAVPPGRAIVPRVLAAAKPFIKWIWIQQNWGQIVADLDQHIELTLIAVGVGLAISIPLAVLAWRYRRWRSAVTTTTSVLYIIPSLALFAILGPITGYFSTTTAEIALVGYTL